MVLMLLGKRRHKTRHVIVGLSVVVVDCVAWERGRRKR